MGSLCVNLRQLYQRRGLWLVYAMFAVFVCISVAFAMDAREAGEAEFIGLIVLAFAIGMSAAVVQMEILTKPFSFCLPGHRRAARSFLFIVAVAANLASATAFLFYPGLFLAERLVVLCSAFFAGLIFYCAGVWLAFRLNQPVALIGFLALAVLGGVLLNLHVLLERAVVLHPVLIIVLGALCTLAMWSYLSDRDLARRNCLRPWVGFGDVFDAEKLRRFQQAGGVDPLKRLKDHPRPWVEDFFIGRIRRRSAFGTGRCLWGSLYASFAIAISRWSGTLVFVLFAAIIVGYMGPQMWIMLAFVPLILVQAYASHPPLYSTMLTAGGRAERYASVLVVGAVAAGLLVVIIGGITVLSLLLAAAMPDITFHGVTLSYRPLSVEAFYAPVVLLPLAYAIGLIFHRRPILMIVVLVMLLYATVAVAMTFARQLAAIRSPLPAAAPVVISWLIFVSSARYMAMRRDLVRR